MPTLGVPARQRADQPLSNWWATIRYAIDSTPRTVRLCAILFATTGGPSSVILAILHHFGITV